MYFQKNFILSEIFVIIITEHYFENLLYENLNDYLLGLY